MTGNATRIESFPRELRQLNQPAVNCFSHRRGPARRIELLEQALHMRFHSTLGDPKLISDLLVALTFGDEPNNLQFTPT